MHRLRSKCCVLKQTESRTEAVPCNCDVRSSIWDPALLRSIITASQLLIPLGKAPSQKAERSKPFLHTTQSTTLKRIRFNRAKTTLTSELTNYLFQAKPSPADSLTPPNNQLVSLFTTQWRDRLAYLDSPKLSRPLANTLSKSYSAHLIVGLNPANFHTPVTLL